MSKCQCDFLERNGLVFLSPCPFKHLDWVFSTLRGNGRATHQRASSPTSWSEARKAACCHLAWAAACCSRCSLWCLAEAMEESADELAEGAGFGAESCIWNLYMFICFKSRLAQNKMHKPRLQESPLHSSLDAHSVIPLQISEITHSHTAWTPCTQNKLCSFGSMATIAPSMHDRTWHRAL